MANDWEITLRRYKASSAVLGPREAPYRGVSRKNFRANRDQQDKAIRQSIGIAVERAKAAAPENIDSIGVLATWGRGVNVVSRALAGDGASNLIPHRVIIDKASVLMSSRVVAFLLEPRRHASAELLDLAEGLELAAAFFRARGGKRKSGRGSEVRGKRPANCAGIMRRANSTASKLLITLRTLRSYAFSGDPKRDWIDARRFLQESGANPLKDIAEDAEELVAFQRGRRIAAGLTDLWQTEGVYRNARAMVDSILAEDQLLSGGDELRGIHVMTIHKSKGKEFDVVIIFDDPNSSPLLFSRESAPYPRCRRLLRVSITRAQHHVLMLCDVYNRAAAFECELKGIARATALLRAKL